MDLLEKVERARLRQRNISLDKKIELKEKEREISTFVAAIMERLRLEILLIFTYVQILEEL